MRIFIILLLAGLPYLTPCVRADEGPNDRSESSAGVAPRSVVPRIVAHRGARSERPENTLAAIERAIEVGADVVEIDVRSSRDGELFLLHDATLDRTTGGKEAGGRGPANRRTMAELKTLDAGSWFAAAYQGERIPTLAEALARCRGRIDVLLDLKESGADYAQAVARVLRARGEPARTILGVHSVVQAGRFRQRLPRVRQLGFIAAPQEIEAFAAAGVDIVRLWPHWLAGAKGRERCKRVHDSGALLQLNGTTGTPQDILPLLPYRPDLLLVDDPATLRVTLEKLRRGVEVKESAPFSYSRWATHTRPLQAPAYQNPEQWADWQRASRDAFKHRFVFPYEKPITSVEFGPPSDYDTYTQQEFHVLGGDRRLFRFFRLVPKPATAVNRELPQQGKSSGQDHRRAAIVCFMGHGKVQQILEESTSYQHACAARFARRGYTVYAMENVGMEPDRDTHLELDRLLRLDGYGWYSLLFAHQKILLDQVFADPAVDGQRVGVTGVSTGGLLALTAIALEPRIAAASVQGIFGSMRVSFIRDRQQHCACGAIPGLLPGFDLPELALLAAPRPLHISNATQDGFSPAEARRCVAKITPRYRQAGGPEPVFSQPPGRHEYAFEPALQFFERTLGKPRRGTN